MRKFSDILSKKRRYIDPKGFSKIKDRTIEFKHAVRYIEEGLIYVKKNDSKLAFIDYALETIKNDLRYEWLSKIYYEPDVTDYQGNFLPPFYHDEEGNEHKLENHTIYENRRISLKNNSVFSVPWRSKSLYNTYKYGRTLPFKNDYKNQKGLYYTELDLCVVRNGYHSSAAGIINKSGELIADSCSINHMFYHVHSDGAYWLNSHNDEMIDCPLKDFRIALIYELAKTKSYYLGDCSNIAHFVIRPKKCLFRLDLE